MTTKTHNHILVFLVLALGLLLILSMSTSYAFAQEDGDDAVIETTVEDTVEDGDKPFRDTLREQKDVRRDFLGAQLETSKMLRDEHMDEQQELMDSGATIDEMRALRSEHIDESRSLHDAQMVERHNIRETQKEGRRAALDAKHQARIEAYANRILVRMNAAIDRLNKIANRVESRIIKLETEHEGLDLSGAKDLLAIARAALETAQTDVDSSEEVVQDMLYSDTPREDFKGVRELLGDAKQSIKDAHKALVDAIVATKASTGDHSEDAEHTHDDDSDDDSDDTTTEEEEGEEDEE